MFKRLTNAPLFINTVAVISLRGLITLTRTIVLLIIARFAAPNEFGDVAFALSLAEIVKVIADFGVDTVAIREFAVTSSSAAQIRLARIIATAKTVCGGSLYLLTVAGVFLISPLSQATLSSVIMLLTLTTLAANLTIDYFQSQLRTQRVLGPTVFTSLAALILITGLLLLNAPLIVVVAVLPLAEGLNALLLFRYFRREVEFGAGNGFDWAAVRALLRQSLPLAGAAIIITLYTRLDVVIIALFMDKTAVGYYSIAYRITEPFQLVALAFAVSVFSHLSATLVKSGRDIESFIVKYSWGVLAYGVVSCLLLSLVAPFVIQIALPQYVPAIGVLQILAVALIFRTVNSFLGAVIQAYGEFNWITGLALWNLTAVVGLLLVFLPSLGLNGAPLALLIAEVVNLLIALWLVRQARRTYKNKGNKGGLARPGISEEIVSNS